MRLITPMIIASVAAAGGLAYTSAQAGEDAGVKSSKDSKFIVTKVGEPKSCVRRSNIRSTRVIDDQTIDFRMRGGNIYRNKLPNKCGGLGLEEAFSYRTSTNQLCNVDIIRVLDSIGGGIRERNACGLGKFQQIEKRKRSAEGT